jgi:8-oxo-dGTP diphosphatase
MYPYTICFIKRANQVLMLNRNFAPNMGLWNGVGGKIQKGESPLQCIIREVHEETGIRLNEAVYKGTVCWIVDGEKRGGMYLFVAELPTEYSYPTPQKTCEGILEWKDISWVTNENNLGVVSNIPKFLPIALENDNHFEHRCAYINGTLAEFESIKLVKITTL